MEPKFKRVAVLTSGGDAPGMNAAVRAVVRMGIALGMDVMGVRNGYTGLIAGDLARLDSRAVGGIIDRGGTFLGSTRCAQIKSDAGQSTALQCLAQQGIEALVVIGGNGSQAGASALADRGLPVVGVASTIDNDLAGADPSLGATTAVDTAVQAIDRLRTTASSHRRVFLVEVMGRDAGYLALLAGIAGGAETIVLPEIDAAPDAIAAEILAGYERGKSHAIVVVAEGARYNAERLEHHFREQHQQLGFELRVSKLGHIQRGGTPGAFDRLLGTRLGAAAAEHLAAGQHGVLIGMVNNAIQATALAEAISARKYFDRRLASLAQTLAR